MLQTPNANAQGIMTSSELAVNDGNNKQDKDGYNGDGNDAISGHAV